MKKILLCFLFFCKAAFTFSQLNYQWGSNPKDVLPLGGNGKASSIKIDAAGNSHVAGYFSGTTDFDPGPGTVNFTSFGESDIFIAKYDIAGNFLFAKQIGSFNNEYTTSLAIDGIGNIYITGVNNGTLDFDPGTGTANLTMIDSECFNN